MVKTVDGIGMKRINALIARLKDFSYQPAPGSVGRISPRPMAKASPWYSLLDDKLVQEVVRMIPERNLRADFLNIPTAFAQKRKLSSRHPICAKEFLLGVKWFVEGDIKGALTMLTIMHWSTSCAGAFRMSISSGLSGSS